jgi:L-seryl-tRNA(Ser) seleniumtransferase
LVVDAARRVLDEARTEALAGTDVPPDDALASIVAARARESVRLLPRPVVNATGVILHTNLGRAPVSSATAAAMEAAMRGYTALEMDLSSGERGSRQAAVRDLATSLTGAEDAFVVNNNAGATLLVLSALAAGHDVLVSRGELVEIGGGFRLPEVFAAGGARLLEVGTTNRTYARDYERALDGLARDPDRPGA